ncbi:hypothetical protein RvVAR0630_pl05990 (plasmid) [Agrobacterium vitis]|nr:hypothetical protein RvVAR0630_pl05990 [Agrobacterium vitis]
MFALAAVYLVILIAAPGQLTHIVANFSTEATFVQWAGFILPPALAAAGLLALSSSRHSLSWIDVLVSCVPSFSLSAMSALWAPRLLWVALLGVPLAALAATTIRRVTMRKSGHAVTITVRLTLVCFALTLIVTLLSPIGFPVAIGPMTVITLGLSFIGLLLSIGALRPGLTGGYLAICLIAAICGAGSRPVPLLEPPAVPFRDAPTAQTAFEAWLKSRPDLDVYRKTGRPYPVIIASAEGGGIYAAAHGFLALSAMQAICPSFPNHLFATVGVSGGSIGTLLYSATSAARAKPGPLVPCRQPDPSDAPVDTKPLTTDLISPPLANLLFAQVADFLIPFVNIFPDSGEILAEAIANMASDNPHMREPLRASWQANGSRPATLFVTTDTSEGNRVIISPLDGAGAIGAASFPSGSITSTRDIALNQAAFISARFPWLTATARLRVSDDSYRILADGGYYENSGADTAMDLIAQIRELGRLHAQCARGKPVLGDLGSCSCPVRIERSYTKTANWSGCGTPVFLAYMPMSEAVDGLPGYTYKATPNPSQSWLGDPLTTMLQARSARGLLAIDRARAAFAPPQDREMAQGTDVDNGFFPHVLPIGDLRLPLGWMLSSASVADVLAVSANTQACGKEHDLNDSIATWAAENGCQMKMLATLFNPEGKLGAIEMKQYGRD